MQDISDIDTLDSAIEHEVQGDNGLHGYSTRSSASLSMGDPSSFTQRLLRALATMAVRSKRRQADLTAAICRGGLQAELAELGPTLKSPEQAGFIEQIVPLYDGGVLISVTSRGIEQLNTLPRWAMMGAS